MRSISEYALTNKALIKFFIALLIVGGVWGFYSMSKMEDPELMVKQALVMTVYPGADAHKVELEVSDKLEKAIRQMGDIDYIESKSMNDLSQQSEVMHNNIQSLATLVQETMQKSLQSLEGARMVNENTSMIVDNGVKIATCVSQIVEINDNMQKSSHELANQSNALDEMISTFKT